MPELPEVETVRRTLEGKLTGRKITSVNIFQPRIIVAPPAEQFAQHLTGLRINKIGRRGKYLLIFLSGGYVVIIHLRMTGHLIVGPKLSEYGPHTHIVLNLDNGNVLMYEDVRKLGTWQMVPRRKLSSVPSLARLGPEAFDVSADSQLLGSLLKSRRRRLKEMLTDQTVMAGIGNIYADEILFQARLLPTRKADTLSIAEINRLAMSIKYVLVRGIRFRGTSIRDYVDGSGQPGKYQHLLKVYGKEGKPCPRCGQPIQRTKIAGRSAYFCNNCQR